LENLEESWRGRVRGEILERKQEEIEKKGLRERRVKHQMTRLFVEK